MHSKGGWSQKGWTSGVKPLITLSAEYPYSFCAAFASAIASAFSPILSAGGPPGPRDVCA
eukprot:6235976-Pyramimonas_sp.AAC.1